jgi:hypothetical protein
VRLQCGLRVGRDASSAFRSLDRSSGLPLLAEGQYGVAVPDGTLLDIELDADDIAALIGTSLVVIAQALSSLQTQAIRINDTSITLLSGRSIW